MAEAARGDLVLIHQVILSPEERAENIPDCTKSVPYEAWIKGFLLDETASIGGSVRIETFIGRTLSGTLVEVSPGYDHGFGKPPLPLITASLEARSRLRKEEAS
ncbi:2-amino-4-ketopentanoate thiolase [Candidatus Bipolaricaulota bacterium]|nr:2-amino-4-ketopentanoate thiolase [Candidatus Bipolaricaulota bacterium]